ncbi:MAG: ferrous iron transporter B, partial [Duodenibacillus sp.]|nr:ferrous iron transporter B [Duodenibacillus sp.]
AFAPMGIKEENWPAAVGVFTGVMAKEAIIGTLSSLYDGIARGDAAARPAPEGAAPEKPWSFGETVSTALERTGGKIAALGGALRGPAGLFEGSSSEAEAAAGEQPAAAGPTGVMHRLFGSRLAAFSYMLLILLYMPCSAATAAVYRQAGFVWTVFLACWTTTLGFSVATIAYRMGSFAEDPLYAAAAIGGCLAVLSAALWLMRRYVQSHARGGRAKRVIRISAVHEAHEAGR